MYGVLRQIIGNPRTIASKIISSPSCRHKLQTVVTDQLDIHFPLSKLFLYLQRADQFIFKERLPISLCCGTQTGLFFSCHHCPWLTPAMLASLELLCGHVSACSPWLDMVGLACLFSVLYSASLRSPASAEAKHAHVSTHQCSNRERESEKARGREGRTSAMNKEGD